MSRFHWRAAGAGGAIVVSAVTGIVTNLITDDFSWGLGVGVVALVAAGVVLAVVITMTERQDSTSQEDAARTSQLHGPAQHAYSSGGYTNMVGRDVRYGMPAAYVVMCLLILAAAVVLIVVKLAPSAGPATGADGDSSLTSTDPATGGTPSAMRSASAGAAELQCAPTESTGTTEAAPAVAGDFVFCPTVVNHGRLPITGPFDLRGQVLGPRQVRDELVLLVRIDPSTCDATGRKGARGRFLLDVDFGANADGSWFHHDDLGGQKTGVTLGRIFEFGRAPSSAVRALEASKERWRESGILKLPEAVTILASFEVPPGRLAKGAACAN